MSEDGLASLSEFPEDDTDIQSARFAFSDADVIVFRSTDGTLFNVHPCNLRYTTDGPLAEDFHAVPGEEVQLPEDAATLEMLFGFVYPNMHPSLVDIPFSKFAAVAEAAEKYHVAAARTLCRAIIRLSALYKDHPLEILDFAFRHDHRDLLDLAAPFSLREEVETARQALSLPIFSAWVAYREAFIAAFRCASIRFNDRHGDGGKTCMYWPEVVFAVDKKLEEKGGYFALSADPDALFDAGDAKCARCTSKSCAGGTKCSEQLSEWKGRFVKGRSAIVPLSRVLSCTN
ncbi:uncharacterized protein SCHCODRAFT_02641439 [Schizophyllum commune H4-8]|uniref:Expressed protein n=1 Tax=Schizophyllum commune (strain H4-8 / FGSC 9210) TaxID=578458 RepID=D8QJH7_SCHCM|nr:uncharacterized protein SCHCODRAFT_02641439 [Schizophyllum commune H4-8]KAI5886324.1 hypothetical protein SCHCODRAFT_02641439 [Schizophyllum commune H4-8]